jgi:hypothetical protein
VEQPDDERSEVAKVYAEQRLEVQKVILTVLGIERGRLHLRRMEKQTVELLTDEIRRIFE